MQFILAGILQYNAPGHLNNINIFCFYEKLKNGNENAATLLLHAMAKDGKTRSKEEIQKKFKATGVRPHLLHRNEGPSGHIDFYH